MKRSLPVGGPVGTTRRLPPASGTASVGQTYARPIGTPTTGQSLGQRTNAIAKANATAARLAASRVSPLGAAAVARNSTTTARVSSTSALTQRRPVATATRPTSKSASQQLLGGSVASRPVTSQSLIKRPASVPAAARPATLTSRLATSPASVRPTAVRPVTREIGSRTGAVTQFAQRPGQTPVRPQAFLSVPGRSTPLTQSRLVPQPSRTPVGAKAATTAPFRVIGGKAPAAQNNPGFRRPLINVQQGPPPPPPGRRMPLIVPDAKAIVGKTVADGRWTCGKCNRLNKELRKVCGRERCGGIAPLNLGQVVIDCANVGCRYGESNMMRPPPGQRIDVERHRKFHWNGVREALKHYQALGLMVSLITKENWPAPIPADLEPFACTVPRVDGDAENDDYFVLKLAYEKNCFYVTNDNFRNWKEEVEDEVMAIWFLATKRHLHVSFVFSNQGEFIPRRDGKLDWADEDDSVDGSPSAKRAKFQTSAKPVASDGELSLPAFTPPASPPEDDKGFQTEDEITKLLNQTAGVDSYFATDANGQDMDFDSDFGVDMGDLTFDGEQVEELVEDELFFDDVDAMPFGENEELELDGEEDELEIEGVEDHVDQIEFDTGAVEGGEELNLEIASDDQVLEIESDGELEFEFEGDRAVPVAPVTPVAPPQEAEVLYDDLAMEIDLEEEIA